MAQPRPKVFEYAVELETGGTASIPGGTSFLPPAGWTADHLLLAALVRCSLESLAHHARRAGSTVRGSGSATGRVTKRGTDGRYAFVEIDCRIDVKLDPPIADTRELTAQAERDCFVGSSLTVAPRYDWRLA
jgi:organic hydroperoxide reductase OsmC/OhrA